MRIGLDLDNTMICYNNPLRRLADSLGIDARDISNDRTEFRRKIRHLPDGENRWQEVQSQLYGPLLMDAELFPGVLSFLSRCQDLGLTCYIVSHKTRFAKADKDRQVDLRRYAIEFLEKAGVFGKSLKHENVFFELTRKDKVARIASLELDAFLDDLPEVFNESDFPEDTLQLLFWPALNGSLKQNENGTMTICRSWQDVGKKIFSFCDASL